ncbi:hypothetical protein [Micromonospora sp. NPDC047134]|uniref:LppU/SCO3897 family protein n=1 Tax=Micromonospora sp. NPDC047134 TaxID=3154340 RepID=UPI0033D26DB6
MTSEGPHHPGHEPDEVPPGGGGSAPYGDRPVQQDNGYGAPAPDLGWAPPPPARPDQAAPAWASQPGAGWGGPQATRQAQSPNSGTWAPPAGGQPSWTAPNEQPASGQPAWAAQGEQPAGGQPSWNAQGEQPAGGQPSWAAQGEHPAANWPAPSTSDQPAWANGGQSNPAWGGGGTTSETPSPAEWTPHQTAPDQSTGGQPGSARPGGWAADQQPEWNAAPRPDEQPPGWATTAGPPESPQQPDWAQGGSPAQPNWAQQVGAPAQPDWAQQAGSPAQPDWQAGPSGQPGWAQSDQPVTRAEPPTRSEPGARAVAQVPQVDPTSRPLAGRDDAARGGAWPAEQQEQPGWATGGQARQPETGGWAGDQRSTDERQPGNDRPAQPDWATPQQAEPTGWSGSGGPADERPQWSPPGQDRPAAAWTPTETSGSATPLPSRTGTDRAPLGEVEPWAPGEAWGSSGAPEAGAPRAEAGRSDESPVYQPAPAPGISPANMVPLPPQEQRVPGASLAAVPPADYPAPGQYSGEQHPQGPRTGGEQPGWGQPEPRQDEAQPSAEAAIPNPRTSPESVGRATPPAATGAVSASASVPTTSRVTPPADHVVRPTGTPAPRVYGRPARPEPEEPVQEREEQPSAPRFDQGPDPRFGEHEQPGPRGFAGAVAPASPAFPPGLPSFADAPATDRPVNGVKPHAEPPSPADRFGGPTGGASRDPFGGPSGGPSGDPFGAPPGDPFGGPSGGAARDPFGGPNDRPGVTYGSPARPDSGGNHTTAFPSGPQANAPWSPDAPAAEPEQGRFDAFKPVAEPAADAPPPKVRNGRVLAAVLVAAVLILAIPLGLLLLLGKFGGSDDNAFDPAVGSCVKRSGETAIEAVCGEPETFSVVSKVDSKDKCPDPALPYVELRGNVENPVLCLKNAAG